MAPKDKHSTPAPEGDRIAKVLSRRGIASRREAERLIEMGEVTVNGKVITSPALNVTDADRITISGEPLPAAEPARLWIYYKPDGLVTTTSDEKGRDTVFDYLPEDMPRVMTIGRLDLNSEGLLLLTNDGELKRRLELPSTGWLRKYRVRVNGEPYDDMLQPLRDGITIDGEHFKPMQVSIDRQQGSNAWLTVGLREGRNREIRRAMNAVGLFVNRLIRVSYGPFRLNDLQPGQVEEVRPRVIQDQIGDLLAKPEGTEDKRESKRLARNDASNASASLRRAPRAEAPTVRPIRPKAPALPSRAAREAGETEGTWKKPVTPRLTLDDDRPARAPYAKPAQSRSYGTRDERPAYGEKRSYGDKPAAPRSEGFRSERPAGKTFSSRSERSYGDKPAAPRSEGFRSERPAGKTFSTRSERSYGDKPAAPRSDSFRAERPAGKTFSSRSERSYSDKPAAPRSDRPYAARDGEAKSGFSRNNNGKPFAERQTSIKQRNEGTFERGSKTYAERPMSAKPRSEGGYAGKPAGKPMGKPTGAKPSGGKPFSKPAAGRPSPSRNAGPSSDKPRRK